MADCCEMKEGDVYHCDSCGLELQVKKACTCKTGAEDACTVPLMCCGKSMVLKS